MVAGLYGGFVNIKYDISIKNDLRTFSESQKPQTRMSFVWSSCLGVTVKDQYPNGYKM